MAEIEMEVDMNRPLDLDDHMDSDLIDFDTDMADQREPDSLHAGDGGQAHEYPLDTTEINFEVEHTENDAEREADALMSEEADLDDTENAMHDADEAHNDANYEVEPEFYNTEDYDHNSEHQSQAEDDEQHVEISQEVEHTAPAVDQESTLQPENEIDYELDEHPEQFESHDDEIELEAGSHQGPLEPEETTENAVKDVIGQYATEVTTQETVDTQNDPDQHQYTAEEDEITYEDEEEDREAEPEGFDEVEQIGVSSGSLDQDDETAPSHGDKGAAGDRLDDSQPRHDAVSDTDGDADGDSKEQSTAHNETTEDAELDEYDVSADVAEKQNDEQEVASERDHSVSGENSAAVSDSESPSITVQYKGDEFPMFSNTSYGFFTQTFILDETMSKLLSGFRDQLASEICDEDELVFQVDELGLEFSESSCRDSLSSVTLRQILEIFDLLVKNQDPDGTRTLYTYLFTKPCATKRLESLIESATAGKGLDEVIHLFESPVLAANSTLAATAAAGDSSAEPLDEYDSLAEETNESDGKPEHEYSQEYGVESNTPSIADENAEGRHQIATKGSSEEYDVEQNADTAEDTTEPQDETFSADAVEQLDETNADDESESDPFVNLELDNDEEDNEVDLEAQNTADEQTQVNSDVAGVETVDTSTTTTLKDDDEIGSIVVDIGADITVPELDDAAEAEHDDDVGEIDWRNEPDADEEALRPTSAAGKRARGDDGNVEDEQDAKRRRP